MNKRETIINRRKNWYRYHIPNKSNLHRIKKNAIFISTANSIEHERKKFEICYEIKQQGHSFVTEAELNRKEHEPRIRRDVVDIDDGSVWEIELRKEAIVRKKRLQKEAFDIDKVIWVSI